MLNPPRSGEIWFAALPDPGKNPSKTRPVLIVEPYVDVDGEFVAAYVLGITSKVSAEEDDGQYILDPSKLNGLNKKSAIKFFWADEVEKRYFASSRTGRLTSDQFIQAMRLYEAFIDHNQNH